jgi:non-specific serine/threonine protein kinase
VHAPIAQQENRRRGIKLDSADSFGTWLRRCRLLMGLTHAELAERAHCSASALRKIERDERRPSHGLAERLAACLQIPVDERAGFVAVARGVRRVERLRSIDAVPRTVTAATAAPSHNLPSQLTSFVGRQNELNELRRLLGVTRLLTLTGAGGIGKTRLALRLGTDAAANFPDGVCWLDLAALTDPALVTSAAAAALGLVERSTRSADDMLVDYLRPRTLLLLMDNCEHMVEACVALAQRLLGAAPNLSILATSRESLQVAGEIAWAVPPLSAPGQRRQSHSEAATLSQFEAVRLFVERAQFAQPTFALTDTNAPAVALVCQQLDGIPLALELAAARVKLMSAEELADRLADRLGLLAGGNRTAPARHRTFRAVIDWSYEQLSDRERLLLERLSVFAGGWSLEAAEAICHGAGLERDEVLDLLAQLVERSLVLVEPAVGGQSRCRLLTTIRQYAFERLEQSGDVARLRDRHRDWFLSLAQLGDTQLRGPDPSLWLARLELEHDNLRAALEWSLANREGGAALRLAGALSLFWGQRGYLREGLRWLDAALAAGGDADAKTRALALHGAGSLAWRLGDNTRSCELLHLSLNLRREAAVPLDLARTLAMLGVVYSAQRGPGDLDRARACFAESLPLARAIGDLEMITHNLNALGEIARQRGNLAEARDCYMQAREASARLGETVAAVILLNLGLVTFAQGDVHAAREYFEQSIAHYRTFDEPGGLAACLDGLAGVRAVCGDPVCAVQLLGAADALRKRIDEPIQPTDSADHERFMAAARSGLDEATFLAAWAVGARLTPEQATALALAPGPSHAVPAPRSLS